MLTPLISFLVLLFIIGVVWYVVTLLPLPPPLPRIAQIILVVVAILGAIETLLPYLDGGAESYPVHGEATDAG